jgi:phage tail protein X
MTYETKEGEMIDEIVNRIYGSLAAIDAVFSLNPGLSGFPAKLPLGIKIRLPEITKSIPTRSLPLWE